MQPDVDFIAAQEAAERATLDAIRAGLGTEDEARLVAEAAELLGMQDQEPDPSCLPTLTPADIPISGTYAEVEDGAVGGVAVQWCDQPTNGVIYIKLAFDATKLPEELLPLFPLFAALLGSVGAGGHGYRQLAAALETCSGGISMGTVVQTDIHDTQQFATRLQMSTHCLPRNLDTALGLLAAVVGETGFDSSEEDRIETLVTSGATGMVQSLQGSGHSYAAKLAAAPLSPGNALSNQLYGLPAVMYAARLSSRLNPAVAADDRAELHEELRDAMRLVGKALLHSGGLRVAVNAERQHFAAVERTLASVLLPALPSPSAAAVSLAAAGGLGERLSAVAAQTSGVLPVLDGSEPAYFQLPVQCHYAAQCFAAPAYTDPDTAALRVLAQVMQANVVHREVREKGGAYGGGAGCGGGLFQFYSYRDPRAAETLTAFRSAVEWAVADGGAAISDRMIDEAKLAIFGSVDAPTAPAAKGSGQFHRGLTPEMAQASRECLLRADRAVLVAAASRYLDGGTGVAARSVVLGPESTALPASEPWKVMSLNALFE
jgi:Zn-dependent M16 (insulinase) family peptidase